MKNLCDFIWAMGEKWQCWAAIILLCIGFEAAALYYQEVLMYYPCELCIYTRVWMTAMALFGVVGLVVRKMVWPRRALLVIEVGLAIGLITVVWELLGIEYGWGAEGACKMVANFPSWARLDEWLPVIFKVQNPCAATPYVIFKISMADGLAVTSVGFLVAFLLALYGSFKTNK